MSWSLERTTKKPRRRPWHDDPRVLAETLNRVPVAAGAILAAVCGVGFLAWLGVPAIADAVSEDAWGTAAWRVVESALGVVFCSMVGFLMGKALTSLILRLLLRLADSGPIRTLETRWESLRTQPTERRY